MEIVSDIDIGSIKLPNVTPIFFDEFNGGYLVTNIHREFIWLSKNDFYNFVQGSLLQTNSIYQALVDKKFIVDEPLEIVATEMSEHYKEMSSYLFNGTTLHILVTTLQCNLRCVYCQVGVNDSHNSNCNMSAKTACKAVEFAFLSPSNDLAFEFQGGEPLLNFEAIKATVNHANSINKLKNKKLDFRLVTNLTAMTDDILKFLIDQNISVCVSLDGNQALHDKNRPMISGAGSYEHVSKWIKRLTKETKLEVSALPTITKRSIENIDLLLNSFCEHGFDSIFLRNLSPFGFAKSDWVNIGYTAEEFSAFYENALNKIIDINMNGYRLLEGFACIILSKLIKKSPINFMELRSPCGAGVGQLAYNWNGDVFTCDEARMLSVHGDNTFRIGNLYNNSYIECLSTDIVKNVLSSSCTECLTECSDCVYSPICGVCPVYNYNQYDSLFAHMPSDYRCKTLKGMYRVIYSKLLDTNSNSYKVLTSWMN